MAKIFIRVPLLELYVAHVQASVVSDHYERILSAAVRCASIISAFIHIT